ncbi:FKBP-type peptidyl-prolyl cis-trans isomerase [Hymenobacter cellulosilyticus]|uniref:Peptidyl-prolyl cis-trans isomerase n=1 Tax=Hymenobacter cellulosilyticus TaxID=2932248 RepID=A0A8T9Q9X7_9BACT|nr:FKBP-type peptidyl-prolyl cis-trans isomerase [Hymenobacter cellulosilyticus]UOQ73945.1 FKBP-type peptidyl-prolyl cis-trans isomerase [Hymenobacter cellulosilyticus]
MLADTVLSQRTASGVRYTVRQPGTGPQARIGDRMLVHYTGFLPDGHIFDSSVGQGKPLRLRVGRGEVIPGWDEILLLLPQGSRARVWIPAALAYGARGVLNPDDDSKFIVPPNTNLVFELEIVKVR